MHGRVHQNGSKVSARRGHADSDSLYHPLELAVQHGRNIFRFGGCDCSFFKIHTAMLWAKEALLVLAALEAWETDSLGVAKKLV